MRHALTEQHFSNTKKLENGSYEWFAVKEEQFFWRGIHNLPESWAKCVESDGQYFE
jgi:hypothetical protein